MVFHSIFKVKRQLVTGHLVEQEILDLPSPALCVWVFFFFPWENNTKNKCRESELRLNIQPGSQLVLFRGISAES